MAPRYFDPVIKNFVTQENMNGYSGVTAAGNGTHLTKTLKSGNAFHLKGAVYTGGKLWLQSAAGDWYLYTDDRFKWFGRWCRTTWKATPGGGLALYLTYIGAPGELPDGNTLPATIARVHG